ncbi:MAG: DUF1330 domain-containing protein [Bacteroidetes bacterium]|nr:DUF1330 domain-containing protein [Bacteroidota bacterium]MCH8524746.1 DUF1330 domain-containing protein [Balneolales bacterium]
MKSILINLIVILFFFTISTKAQTEISNDTSSPKIFVVLDITVHDTVMYEQYTIEIEPVVKKYGGKYLVRSGGAGFEKDPDKEVIPGEGNWNPNRLIILEWNSMEELQNFINSAENQKLAQLRNNAASTKSVIVKEYLTD